MVHAVFVIMTTAEFDVSGFDGRTVVPRVLTAGARLVFGTLEID